MRIVIDMQGCQNLSRNRGIGRYTTGMVTGFLKEAVTQHDCHLLFNGQFNDNLGQLINHYSDFVPISNIHIWYGIGPCLGSNANNKINKNISVILREKFIEKIDPDFVFLTTYFEGYHDDTVLSIPKTRRYKVIATSHDLIPLIQPKIYLDPNPDFKKYYLEQISEFKEADLYAAVSNSCSNELKTYLGISKEKIIITSEGIEKNFKNSMPSFEKIEKMLDCKLKDKKLIFYFGASDERKNHLKLIKAYSLLSKTAKQNSKLIIAGILNDEHLNKFKNYAYRCGLNNEDYIFLKYITDKQLIDLYSVCYLFVFPSFHEGFGLPALEAMACGAAVITSNTTSLPEVIGRKDLTFDPYNALEIKKLLENLIENPKLRNEISQYCESHSKTFTWEKSAKLILDSMESFGITNERVTADTSYLINSSVKAIKKITINDDLSNTKKEQIALKIIKNFRENRKPRILYDISQLITVDFITGIQRVTNEIYNSLIESYSDQFEIIPIKISHHSDILEAIENPPKTIKINKKYSSIDINDIRIGDIFISIDLDHNAHTKEGAYEKLRSQGCKTVFVIHDLLPFDFGDSFFSPNSAVAHFGWFKAIAKADHLVCVSQSVMEHSKYYLNAVENINTNLKIGWFHLGGNFKNEKHINLDKNLNIELQKINFSNPVFLMVGSVEPRKGHLEVIEAMSDLWDSGYQGSLVIVGARGWNNDLVIEVINSSQYKDKLLFWPSKISDADLAYLYKNSTALIAASLGEGFGLPLIESLQHNTPVIARNIPVFREVTKNSCLYFNDAEDLKNIILKYHKQQLGNNFTSQNWGESAKQLMNAITKGHNSETWHRDDKLWLLPVCSNKFNSTSGIYSSDRIKSKFEKGLLVWGGYFPLESGSYDLKIYGKSYIEQEINLKIVTHLHGEIKVLFEKRFLTLSLSKGIYDIPEIICNIPVSLNESIDRAEIYIESSEKNDLYVSCFEIKKTSDLPFILLNTAHNYFKSEIGLKNESGIYTQNKKGNLLTGGLVNLDLGKYTIEILGTSPQNQMINFSIGYYDEFNSKQIAVNFNDLPIQKSTNSIISKKIFNLENDIQNAEFFIDVNEDNKLKISEIRLQRI